VDRELEEESSEDDMVKAEAESPRLRPPPGRRVRVVKRLVERPKSVYERFPAFEKDKVLDFSELFKGFTVRKSRLSKRPFHSTFSKFSRLPFANLSKQSSQYTHGGRRFRKGSWMLSSEILGDR
jgi:hypothetical protein